MCGMVDLLMMLLKRLVMYWMALGPKCLSMTGEIASGPIAFELLDFLMAFSTWSLVMMSSWSEVLILCMLRRSLLLDWDGFVVGPGVYCRLNWSAIFLGFVWCLWLNTMLWLSGFLGGFVMLFMVFQRVLVPGPQLERCSSHFFFLWSRTEILISLFKSLILLSAGFSFLMRSLSSTSRAVSVDMALWTAGILPQGMLFLAALVIIFLRNLSFEKTSSDEGGEDIASSICWVNFGQLALLKFTKV